MALYSFRFNIVFTSYKGVMLMSDKRKELIAEIKDELSDLTDEQIKRLLQLIKEEQRQSA